MGFLSNLFGGSSSKSKSSSLVLQWAEKRMNELRHENEITTDGMFAGFIYCLSTFAESDPKRKVSKEMAGLGMDTDAHFANDSALFELGCYLYFRADMWLFLKRPSLRDRVSTVYLRSFIALFTQALQIPNVAELFEQRVDKYGELAREGADAERYHYYLSQLILRTKDNQKPEPYDFDNEPVLITGGFEDFGLKIKLMSWETAMLPALAKSMDEATNLLK